MSVDEEYQLEVAKAITLIGKKHSVSDFLSLEMPADVLMKVSNYARNPDCKNIRRCITRPV